MKKNKTKSIRFLVFMFVVTFLFLAGLGRQNDYLTGKAIYFPPTPTSCSNESITLTWDSIFKESSSNIIINSTTQEQNKCNLFTAYKIKNGQELYILSGMDIRLFFTNTTIIMGSYINFTKGYINESNFDLNFLNMDFSGGFINNSNTENITKRNINNEDYATSELNYYFKKYPSNWSSQISSGIISFITEESNSSQNTTLTNLGIVNGNYSANAVFYLKAVLDSPIVNNCVQNWTLRNTTISPEKKIYYYIDSNNCRNATGMPNNRTEYFDHDNNGIIGNETSFFSTSELDIYIDSSLLNLSKIYNSSKKIEFRENSVSRVAFDYSFSSPINLYNISIKKQTISGSFGYLIVQGISSSKTLAIDRLSSLSNSVCIKDSDVENISQLSQNCTSEYLVLCPGNSGRFSCNISNNTFIVKGIEHSAVREIFYSQNASNCTPSWGCSNWGECIGNQQERNCMDLRVCNKTFGKPPEIQVCVECDPVWNCTEWTPKKCPSSRNQTRICRDMNQCGNNNSKLPEVQECRYYGDIKAVIMVLILTLIIVVVIVIVILHSKENKPENSG